MQPLQLSIQNKREIIKKAICHYAALINPDMLPEKVFLLLAPYINPNFIEDKALLSNDRVKSMIDWDLLDKQKLIRLIIRDKYVLEQIDLNKHDFTLRDLIPIWVRHPDLIDYFDVDWDDLSGIDAIKMLKINPVFIDKIDLGKYKYSKFDIAKILEDFHQHPNIIDKMNLDTLDHFSIRTLLIKSGDKYLHKLDLSKLKVVDWLEILKRKPLLREYCDMDIFKTGDMFYLVKLVETFPDLDYIIEEHKEQITAIGWETLLIQDPDKYSQLCDFEKLSKKNWDVVTTHHPNLINIRNRYML